MSENTRNIAVITGDLVNSTELGREKVERAFAALEDCAETQADWHGAPLHFTRHRGDGWQVVLARPEMALRSALAFRAALRAEGSEFDSRLAVAYGLGPHPNNIERGLNGQTEEVFVGSGQSLDAMKSARIDIRMSCDPVDTLTAVFALADHIAQSWTPTQAMATRLALDPSNPTVTSISERLGKSRQAVSKSLLAAGIEAITVALIALELEEQS